MIMESMIAYEDLNNPNVINSSDPMRYPIKFRTKHDVRVVDDFGFKPLLDSRDIYLANGGRDR